VHATPWAVADTHRPKFPHSGGYFKAGILVKDRMALERMRTIDTVIFDKTGTLTQGNHVVVGVAAVDGVTEDDVLRLAGAVEADSEHPLARAIVTAATERGVHATVTEFRSITGRGVEATVDRATVAVGGPAAPPARPPSHTHRHRPRGERPVPAQH